MARLRAMDETDDSPVVVDGKEYRAFECPSCGFPICEWTDCPECGWYNEDIWEVTEQYHGFGDELATDGGQTTLVDTDEELPAIETVEQFDDGTPRYCRCEGCGASGPSAAGLDDREPVILHEKTCPHAEDSR